MIRRTFDFLKTPTRPKIVRTSLYGDQEFSLWELEIIHTPVFQRLYDLKQLGFADRVYPDAVHSRFNHVLGVAYRAEQMLGNLINWLQLHDTAEFHYAQGSNDGSAATINGQQLGKLLKERREAVRLIGLLHDLTHAAYGHTLEDEVQVFTEKHDSPPRQQRFFDALTAQMLAIWSAEGGLNTPDIANLDSLRRLDVDRVSALSNASAIGKVLETSDRDELVRLLRQLRDRDAFDSQHRISSRQGEAWS